MFLSFLSSASAFSRASLRQLGLGDLRFQLGHFAFAVLAVAQLLLNGLHLLIQIIFALGALHLGFDAGLDLFLDLQDAHFALHQAIDLFQPLADRKRLQHFLLLRHVGCLLQIL